MIDFETQTLVQKVIDTFNAVPPPPTSDIARLSGDGQGLELRNAFGGINWIDVPHHLVAEHYDQLPIFEAEAFHYYLPAFIVASLTDSRKENLVLEFLVYLLESIFTKDGSYYLERRCKLSPNEISTIRQFLQMILNKPEIELYRDNVAKTLLAIESRY